MTIGFVVWNPFQVFHMGPITDHLDDAVFIVLNRKGLSSLRSDFGGSISSFINHPHEIVTPRQLLGLDGKLDALVCPNPFPGMNSLVTSRRVGIQYSMTKESYQYGAWRSHFDINLAYGDYTVGRLLRYGPAVAVGNPRFTPWFNRPHEKLSPSQRKTIVYLPTWGEFSSVPTFLPAIESLQDDYDVIVKLHHKIHLTEPDKTDQLASSGIKNAYLPHDDLLPLLRNADLVISDFSGAIFDAIYVRKPVLLLQENPDSLVGQKFTFNSIEYARRGDIGPVVSSPEELGGAVAAMLDGSLDYRESNEQLRAECFAEDVDAAERCAEVIKKFSRYRRNPQSPAPHRTPPRTMALTPGERGEDLVERIQAKHRAKAEAGAKSYRPTARARLRKAAKAALGALGTPVLLLSLMSAPGPRATTVRRKLARIALRISKDPAMAISTLEALRRRGVLDTRHDLWLADLYFINGRGEDAAKLVDSISHAEALSPDLLKILAQTYRTVSGATANWGALVGMLESPAPAPAVSGTELVIDEVHIEDVQRRVAQNAASIATIRTDFDMAATIYEELVKGNDDLPDLHYRHAKALNQAFRFDEARNAYAEAVRRSPFNASYRRSYTSSCSKAEQWQEARSSSLDIGADLSLDTSAEFRSGKRQRSVLDILDSAFQDPTVVTSPSFPQALNDAIQVASLRRTDYWIALHWRLIRAGAYSAAYQVKDLAAWTLLDDASLSRLKDPRSTIRLSQALVTLGAVEAARQLLSLELDSLAPGNAAARIGGSKALADLDFLEGDVSSIVRWAESVRARRFEQDEAHRTARDLFAGRRVAIIGPGRPPEGVSDARFDSYDVVVRPNLFLDEATARATGSRRTDVVYFNSGFTRLGLDELLGVAADQGVRQVVLRRPRDLGLLDSRVRSGMVRFVDIEPSCHLYASSFGIQRLLYDISLYRPRSIDVFNLDFFAGEVEYVEGYKVENADVSFRGYSHDFRGDFILSQNLRASGAAGFDAVSSSLLDMDVTDYLALLDAKQVE